MPLRLLTAVLLTATAVPALAAYPTSLYVFGDSLVDAGNARDRFGPGTANPAQGYFQGRFTDGPDYTDLISQNVFGSFTVASRLGGDNYAYGGARAVDHGDPIPDLGAQITDYLGDAGGVGDSTGLYIINVGGNDVFGLLSGNLGGQTPADYATAVVTNITSAVAALGSAGAGKILVTGIPNFGAPGAALLQQQLDAALDVVEPALPGQLIRFSYFDFFSTILTDPGSLGLPPLDTTTPCITVRPVVNGDIDCTGFFSFDGIHFTADVHRALAGEVIQAAGIPEPDAWALMIAGFGLVGVALRRRRGVAFA